MNLRYGASCVLCILAGAVSSGCALTSKADVVTIRYFTPEHVKPRLNAASDEAARAHARTAPDGALEVRLGRVSSGPNLRERIAYRDAAYELGYYDDWRWSERPEAFVRRELGRTLFEQHGFRRVFAGAGPTLDVEVIAFDDLRLPKSRAARVELKVILADDAGVLFEDTITVDRPVTASAPKIEDVVAAMAGALDAAAEQIAERTGRALTEHRKAMEATGAGASDRAAPSAGGAGATTTSTSITTTTTTAKPPSK